MDGFWHLPLILEAGTAMSTTESKASSGQQPAQANKGQMPTWITKVPDSGERARVLFTIWGSLAMQGLRT